LPFIEDQDKPGLRSPLLICCCLSLEGFHGLLRLLLALLLGLFGSERLSRRGRLDNVLGVGTMNAAVSVVNTLRTFGASHQILPERVATLSTLRNRNAILFGAPVDREAITRTMQDTPLLVDYEPSIKEFVIRGRTSGMIIAPRREANGDFTEVYGLVTVLNTRETDHGRLGMIVFSGITSAGTHGAAEYFSSPRCFRSLRSIFEREGLADPSAMPFSCHTSTTRIG
jgi:hypothetical protein